MHQPLPRRRGCARYARRSAPRRPPPQRLPATRASDRAPRDRTNHAFPRQTHHHRISETRPVRSSRRSSVRLCSSVLPKPKPGSITIRSRPIPASSTARSARSLEVSSSLPRQRLHSWGASCIVRGSPRMCIRHTAASEAATARSTVRIRQRAHVVDQMRTRIERGSRDRGLARIHRDDGSRSPRDAPRSGSHAAVLRLRPLAQHRVASTRRRRRSIAAPSSIIAAAAATAAPTSKRPSRTNRPPSENESGVTFRMPITHGVASDSCRSRHGRIEPARRPSTPRRTTASVFFGGTTDVAGTRTRLTDVRLSRDWPDPAVTRRARLRARHDVVDLISVERFVFHQRIGHQMQLVFVRLSGCSRPGCSTGR